MSVILNVPEPYSFISLLSCLRSIASIDLRSIAGLSPFRFVLFLNN